MPATAIALGLGLYRGPRESGDTTPGGATDVWLWEDGIGFAWETGILMLTE